MLYVSFFLCVTLIVYACGQVRLDRKALVQRRLDLATGVPAADIETAVEAAAPGRIRRAAAVLVQPLLQYWRRRMGRRMESVKLELRLLQAGRPLKLGAAEFRLLQMALCLFAPAAGAAYGLLLGFGIGGIVAAAGVCLLMAAGLPGYYLRLKAAARAKLALRELPDVLDLLTVSLEAGLGFDAALSKLVSKSDGVLCAEFQRCLEEIRLGKTRREALIGVRDRVVLDELRVLISSILQAERLGIGMVQVLRVQSAEVREQRRQRAEEAAMKAPIKMLFPLVLFVFPSLFIVLLGPALLQFIETFSS